MIFQGIKPQIEDIAKNGLEDRVPLEKDPFLGFHAEFQEAVATASISHLWVPLQVVEPLARHCPAGQGRESGTRSSHNCLMT
jgi:hypothetical protein